MLDTIREKALEIFSRAEYVATADITFHPEIRDICAGNACRMYGKNWACPPAGGTIEECEARVKGYKRMLLFSRIYDIEDDLDYEGMMEGHDDFQHLVDRLHEAIEDRLPKFLLLSNEGCIRCEKCTYPDAPCRFPDKLHHTLEGYGIFVSDTARLAGMEYINGKNTVTYFGALLFD